MTGTGDLTVRALSSGAEREFDDLVGIYEAVLPASERKDTAALRRMLESDACAFSLAELGDQTAGFAIRARLAGTKADLLEYMGVTPAAQGRGVGRALFASVAAASAGDGRFLLLEVEAEDDDVVPAERRRRERRKAFYRDLDCREVAGLTYILPDLGGHAPPRMNLLVHGRPPPPSIARSAVRSWLEAMYVQVYGRAADDPAIAAMLSGLPETAALT